MSVRSKWNKLAQMLLALIAVGLLPSAANAASVNSNTVSVTLNAAMSESLTVSLTLSTVTFGLVSGVTIGGSAAVPITTTWALLPSRSSVKLYGYFASSTAALTDGLTTPDNIPSSSVFGQMTTGSPVVFTPFTQTASGFGAASASLLLFNQTISLGNSNFIGTRVDNLLIQIATPLTLPAGTYTGTLSLQAQAN
jgi:hypothetical protein